MTVGPAATLVEAQPVHTKPVQTMECKRTTFAIPRLVSVTEEGFLVVFGRDEARVCLGSRYGVVLGHT